MPPLFAERGSDMKLKQGFILRKFAGQTLVIAAGDAGSEKQFAVKLNATAEEIWQGIAEGLTESEIADRLAEKYELTKEQAQRDTHALIDRMKQAGFFEPEENK